MAVFGTYYIDAATFATASGVYTDAALTTGAPDGYYSDGIIYRLQTGGVLARSILCPTCLPACSTPIGGGGGEGVFYVTFDMGSSIGAIIITLTPTGSAIPIGLTATYGVAVSNEFSSVNDGYLAGTAGLPTFVGDTAFDCGLSGGTFTENEYVYSGGVFTANGLSKVFGVAAGQVQTTTGTPGACVMVISKLNISPNTLSMVIYAPCAGSTWTISAACPVVLTGISCSTAPQISAGDACTQSFASTYYNAPVTGTSGSPAMHDWIFVDVNAQQKLSDAGGAGFYKWDDGSVTGSWFQIDANSVIISVGLLGACP